MPIYEEPTERSDRELQRELRDRLGAAEDVDAGGVELLVMDAIVTLNGHVPDFDTRRRIVAICEAAEGVKEIHDDLLIANETTVNPDEPPEPRRRGA